MIGAVWKLIVFTIMVNRIINIGSNEIIILQVCDTCILAPLVTQHTSRR
jgi:hypothetical protein